MVSSQFLMEKLFNTMVVHLFFRFIFFLCMCMCRVVEYVHMSAVLTEARRGHWIFRAAVTGIQCGCWELNSGILQENGELLTSKLPL